MTVNPLPPQAYTKETLQKAYAWLLGQNASVKDLATTQDILVSMYLKAQRNGDAVLETPSIQNFKQELKSLANLIGDLQTPNSNQKNSNSGLNGFANSQNSSAAQASLTTALPTYSSAPATSSTSTANQSNAHLNSLNVNQNSNAGLSQNHRMPQTFVSSSPSLGGLDDLSLSAIQEVRQALNLGSDIEALRALISLGYKQFKKM